MNALALMSSLTFLLSTLLSQSDVPLSKRLGLSNALGSSDVNGLVEAAIEIKELRIAGFARQLRAVLRQLRPKQLERDVLPACAIVDALIACDVKVTDQDIGHCYGQPIVSGALVLAARNPNKCESFLLRVFAASGDHGDTNVHFGSGNILAASRSKLFARYIVVGLEVTCTVVLTDPGYAPMFAGFPRTGHGAAASKEKYRVQARGFKNLVIWQLGDKPTSSTLGGIETKGRLLAPGLRGSHYYPRTVEPDGYVYLNNTWPLEYPSRMRMYWLSKLLGSSQLPMESTVRRTIQWNQAKEYTRDIKRMTDKIRGAHAGLVNRLIANGHRIPANWADKNPVQIKTIVVDERKKASSLPDLEDVIVTRFPKR